MLASAIPMDTVCAVFQRAISRSNPSAELRGRCFRHEGDPGVSRTSLAAVRTDALADAGLRQQRVVSVRFFEAHVHRLALLALAEAAMVMASVYAAVLVRFHGYGFTMASVDWAAIVPRALVAAPVF